MEQPMINPTDWIVIGKNRLRAVVCIVLENKNVEVVYFDRRGRAISEDVRWDGSSWKFVHEGPSGRYADNFARLNEFVSILKSRPR